MYINTVAVLGSGVMGAQIAAHFANAQLAVILFDLKDAGSNANAIPEKALANLKKINPNPLSTKKALQNITVANYDDDAAKLTNCDLIIEVIAERMDLKVQLFNKISKYINSSALVASNTSGLSITELANHLPATLQAQFCGIHFFNPPRYMPLIELIPHPKTNANMLIALEEFLVSQLGKSVLVAKDTPNFIANRIGVFSMLAILFHAAKFDIPFEVVDQLTGKNMGRPKSATFRTADLVGLDTFLHVVHTMQARCHDGFEACYVIPTWLQQLVDTGKLGQKTKAGIYTKKADGIHVIDIDTGNYKPATAKAHPEILAILKLKSWKDKIAALHDSTHPEAQFLWSVLRDLLHYCSSLLGEIADTARAMDLALRWGFGWKEGIFEICQQADWLQVVNWTTQDITNGKSIAKHQLPTWISHCPNGVYISDCHYNIHYGFTASQKLPIYARQLFPTLMLTESSLLTQIILYENDGVKLWHSGDNIGILSFKTKMCAIGMNVLHGIDNALDIATQQCLALVISQETDIFSVGANLEEFGFAIMMNGASAVEDIISTGHRIIAHKIRYSKIPIVAGVKGYTFGGGCEIMLQCTAIVAALESYIGLVEAGVGLLPGWGGSTEMVLRAATAIDPWQDFTKRYQNLAMAKVATSAYEALEMGFLRESDTIVMNSKEVLFVAKERAKYLALSGYKPPVAHTIAAFGEQGNATIKALLVNMHEGKQISDHDYLIASLLAEVMCGGNIQKGSMIDQDWLLALEKQNFQQLALSAKTADRIQHMLEHGKPLRN